MDGVEHFLTIKFSTKVSIETKNSITRRHYSNIHTIISISSKTIIELFVCIVIIPMI